MSKMMRTSTSSVRSDPIKKGFEVRVPERRRFQHVGSKLDTGATARRGSTKNALGRSDRSLAPVNPFRAVVVWVRLEK